MSVFKVKNIEALPAFQDTEHQLAIVERQKPQKADIFFQKLMQTPFRIIGQVHKESSLEDIQFFLADEIPQDLKACQTYRYWLRDMAQVCEAFCDTLKSESIGFCLSTERGCRRFHIDNVPLRLLVTYAGQGTEWLPDEAANRNALQNGAANEDIIKDPSQCKFLKSWDVAVFRGGPKGLLHRTPDTALNGPSILMRLDHKGFWENILQQTSTLASKYV